MAYEIRDHKKRSTSRRIANVVVLTLSSIALLAVIAPSIWIVVQILKEALPHFNFSVLTKNGVGLGGGLKNEIVGTLVVSIGVVLVAGSIGILSGIFLAQYARGRFASVLRAASDILAGIPSIVLGYVGYSALVVGFHWGFSLGAGVITLSVLVIPYIAKTTEVALRQVPINYIEGAEALGFKPTRILSRITLKTALPGITTGLIVAMAISVGETAPLLYTAGYSQNLPKLTVTHSPLGYLTYAVWTFYNQPTKTALQLSYDAALIIMVLILLLIGVSRVIVAQTQRHAETRR